MDEPRTPLLQATRARLTGSTPSGSESPVGPQGPSTSTSPALIRIMRRPTTGAIIGTLFVFTFFGIAGGSAGFLTLKGTANWVDQAAELGIVAVPVGLLMMAGEFDLSIASVLEASALVVSVVSGQYGLPLGVSLAIAFGLAAAVGLLNGIIVVRTGLPSFIVTLATYFALAGLSLALVRLVSTTTTVTYIATGSAFTIFAGSVGQFNISIVWMAAIAFGGGWILTRTTFGNWLLATGGDKSVAHDAGVPTDRVKVTLFVATALGAALVGVIQAIEYGGAGIGQGANYIFDAIVACVVGGVLLQGGYGSVTGIVLGTATYSIVNVGIFYTGWDSDLFQLFIGVLVLAAVLANNFFRSMAMKD